MADAKPVPPEDLVAMFQQLLTLEGVELAKLARKLAKTDGPTMATLRVLGDKGTWEATRTASYLEVARELGHAQEKKVGEAVTRHNKRRRGEL
jgi:hypothetical protein